MSIHNMHGWRDLEVRRQKISRHSAGTMKCGRVQKCEGGYFDTVSEILPSGFVVTRSAGAAAAVAGIEYSSSGFQNSNRSIFLFFFPNKKCINGDHLDIHIFLSLSLDCHIFFRPQGNKFSIQQIAFKKWVDAIAWGYNSLPLKN